MIKKPFSSEIDKKVWSHLTLCKIPDEMLLWLLFQLVSLLAQAHVQEKAHKLWRFIANSSIIWANFNRNVRLWVSAVRRRPVFQVRDIKKLLFSLFNVVPERDDYHEKR